MGCEIIDAEELAKRWQVPVTWIYEGSRKRTTDPIPHIRFGKYIRFQWGCPDLEGWLERRKCCEKKADRGHIRPRVPVAAEE